MLQSIIYIYEFKERHKQFKSEFVDSGRVIGKHFNNMVEQNNIFESSVTKEWIDSIKVYLKMLK